MTAKRLKQGLLMLLAPLALLAFTACDPASAQDGRNGSEPATPSETVQSAPRSAPESVRAVRTVQAEQGVLSTSRNTSVTIEPAQESQVAAGTSGRVATVLRREGSQVQAGEVVVRLDDEDLRLQASNARVAVESARVNLQTAERSSPEGVEQARMALRVAEVNLELAQKQYREGEQLYAAGGISANELAGLEAQLAQSQSAYRQAEDALARSQRSDGEDIALLRLQLQQAQTQLSQAERALTEAEIKAPFSGEIAQVLVEQGEFVGSGSPVFRLVSSEEQVARFSVPVQDANQLLRAGIVWIDYGGLNYAAQITRSSQVPGQTRLVDVTAEIYPSQTRIPTGTVTQLSYELELGSGIRLPSGAVQTAAGRSYVYVVQEGLAQRRDVRVINEAADVTVIQGVDEGAEIVFPVPSDLRDGTRVNVVNRTN